MNTKSKAAVIYRTCATILGAGMLLAGSCQAVGNEVVRAGLSAVVNQLNPPQEDPSFSDWFRNEVDHIF
ncbi:MAG: hypothetical protein J5J06_10520 [Phycisphaerae bacterium]|nr:hypothetical protein [Phycisphaerae bacterium]